MSLRLFLPISVFAVLISACATPPRPYVLPDGAFSANMKSSISGAHSHNESININVVEEDKKALYQLFKINKSASTPPGYQRVPANKLLVLHYNESVSGGRFCKVTIQVVLEAGQNYSLVGGMTYKSGPIPVLMGTRGCQFGIINDETGKPVPIQQAKQDLSWLGQ